MDQPIDNLIGESTCFLEVVEQVSQLALINKPALIVGERGTGKELIAARLHYLSKRWQQPFVKLNCTSINENLLESELFGHEAGSFTGASKRHLGRFERANRGTLFLDELGNSSSAVQEKLLRVVEYGELERVGGSKTVKIDVRLIAATNEDLPRLVRLGKFRADLLDRLAFDVVTLPPLRERSTDILILAQYFGMLMSKELNRAFFAGFSRNAKQELTNHPWPGNVRELKNVIERNVYKAEPETIIDTVQFDPFESNFRLSAKNNKKNKIQLSTEQSSIKQPAQFIEFPINLKETLYNAEISIIKKALYKTHFNQKKCAELLGLTYHQLRGYLKKYQLLKQK